MRAVHLTSVHRAFDVRIFHKECRSLAAEGYEVVLVAPHEKSEKVDGVRIRAVPRPVGRLERMTRTVWEVYRAGLEEDGDVYHFHDPELIPAGLRLRRRGRRVICDVHEDLPRQIFHKEWVSASVRAPVSRVLGPFEQVAYRLMSGVVAATPAIASRFRRRRMVLVQNFPRIDELSLAAAPAPTYVDREPLVVYVGGASAARGAQEMVEAMGLLPVAIRARLILAGRFSDSEVERKVRGMPGWNRVEAVGWLARTEVMELLRSARVGVVVFRPVPMHVQAWPTKLFEYMLAGLPVVASDFPLWREIVARAGCGLLVDPLKPVEIGRALEYLLCHPEEAEAMGRRGLEAVLTSYNWRHEEGKLLAFYKRVAGAEQRG